MDSTRPSDALEREPTNVGRFPHLILTLGPPTFALFYFGLLWVTATSRFAVDLLQERMPIELLAFACLILAAVLAVVWWRELGRHGAPLWQRSFAALFGVGVFFVGMEEVSWGQWILQFETPESWARLNDQEELNLHNLHGIQGHSEIMHLTFGLGGLVGLWAGARRAWRTIAVPRVLGSLILMILIIGTIDLYTDYFPVSARFNTAMRWMSEIAELYIAVTALSYVMLARRRLR